MADAGKEILENDEKGTWEHIMRGMWSSPFGLLGLGLTTVSITLIFIGLIAEFIGLVKNPYVSIFTFLVLPAGMVAGLLIIPLAAYLSRRRMHRHGIAQGYVHINLSDPRHRKMVVVFIVLTVINITILGVIGYEGYHFTDSTLFCGVVCHTVMEPEYTVYQRSPHARVACVECHIGPGADWFVRAKISGLRQVYAVMAGSFSRPIPAPVEHLRPARETCEECHWPEKFSGKRVKTFARYSNDDQQTPQVVEIALHIGGRNPLSDKYEGIHWHVSRDVEVRYLAADEKRMKMARVTVKRPDGSENEFVDKDLQVPEAEELNWRVMDCIDCHNRPTHIYDLPEDVVDFGLRSRKIDAGLEGIRQDGLSALKRDYKSRDEARKGMVEYLTGLQRKRNGDEYVQMHSSEVKRAGEFLLESYLQNVWPEMNVEWGTYGSHLGHQRAGEGYGCFRCHGGGLRDKEGMGITQDCTLCHDFPAYITPD